MVGDEIQKVYNQSKWALVLRGLLSLLVGIAILTRPMPSVAALALVIALWALFDGSVNIVRSFQVRQIAPHWWVLLVSGIVGVGFGIAALYYFPGLSLAFAVLWVAYWLILSGVIALFLGYQERKVGVSWGWTVLYGAVALVGGVIALMYPMATLAALLGFIAGFSIIASLFLFMAAARMQAFQSDVRNAMPSAARA
jgi:uncharacterized membrane protein HdeD (DUF308 family)